MQSNIFSLLLNDTFQDRINIQSHHLGTIAFKEKATRIGFSGYGGIPHQVLSHDWGEFSLLRGKEYIHKKSYGQN